MYRGKSAAIEEKLKKCKHKYANVQTQNGSKVQSSDRFKTFQVSHLILIHFIYFWLFTLKTHHFAQVLFVKKTYFNFRLSPPPIWINTTTAKHPVGCFSSRSALSSYARDPS
jgi:hypothetical protein